VTPEDVRRRVEHIRSIAADDEAAHSEEDSLHQEVLMAIARGEADDPAKCAYEALQTAGIDFSRWRA